MPANDRVYLIDVDEGELFGLWTDDLDFTEVGIVKDAPRASDVQFRPQSGGWVVTRKGGDFSPPFKRRADAIAWEVRTLNNEIAKGISVGMGE